MSKDDFSDLPPIGKNPLEGDLLADGALGPTESAPTMDLPSALDEGEAISAPAPLAAEEPAAEAETPKEASKPELPGFVARLAQSNPYNVMLFVSLVALLIGILCLLLEWGAYRFEVKPSAGHAAPSSGTAATAAPPRAAV